MIRQPAVSATVISALLCCPVVCVQTQQAIALKMSAKRKQFILILHRRVTTVPKMSKLKLTYLTLQGELQK